MTTREERVAQNEAIARDINESIGKAHAEASENGQVRLICECGLEACERLIAISVDEYEQVRRDAAQFALIREHVVPDVESVVMETDRYVVVQKHPGRGSEIAQEQYPRSG